MTGRNEAYYTDYLGNAAGIYLRHQVRLPVSRGSGIAGSASAGERPASECNRLQFINFIQNHDQIANSSAGARAHKLTSPGRYRALTALLLLAPDTPMLFQGQEFASSEPFYYFADHNPILAKQIHDGRAKFLAQFRSMASTRGPRGACWIPANRTTFRAMQARFRRTRAPPVRLCTAPGPASACAATIPCFGRSARAAGRRRFGRRSLRAALLWNEGDDRLLIREPGQGSSPEPGAGTACWRRRGADVGDSSGRVKTCTLMAACGTSPPIPTTELAPARSRRASSCGPTPAEETPGSARRRMRVLPQAHSAPIPRPIARPGSANGWSPTGSAATRPAPCRGVITRRLSRAARSPRCRAARPHGDAAMRSPSACACPTRVWSSIGSRAN